MSAGHNTHNRAIGSDKRIVLGENEEYQAIPSPEDSGPVSSIALTSDAEEQQAELMHSSQGALHPSQGALNPSQGERDLLNLLDTFLDRAGRDARLSDGSVPVLRPKVRRLATDAVGMGAAVATQDYDSEIEALDELLQEDLVSHPGDSLPGETRHLEDSWPGEAGQSGTRFSDGAHQEDLVDHGPGTSTEFELSTLLPLPTDLVPEDVAQDGLAPEGLGPDDTGELELAETKLHTAPFGTPRRTQKEVHELKGLSALPETPAHGSVPSHILDKELNVAASLITQGRNEQVHKRFQAVARAFPEDLALYRCFAETFIGEGEIDAGVEWLFMYASQLCQLGNFADARETVKRVIQLDSNHEGAKRISHMLWLKLTSPANVAS